jgi:multidrug efflux system outer membrane protein
MRLAILMGLLLASCAMGPDFVRPTPPTPADFRSETPAGESIANTDWWDLYQDPALQGLIRRGLENNRSLHEALARINEARARLGIVRADLKPQVIGVGLAHYQNTIGNDSAKAFDNVKVMASASYEVDLWGRIKRANEAALQGLLATEEAFRTISISLVADIAGAYLTLRDLDARIEIADATLKAREASLALLRFKAEGGLVAEVDVRRAEINLADVEAVRQNLLRARSQTENAISLLVGRLPDEVVRGVPLAEQSLPLLVPAGLPSELLQRRPDVLAAERALHAQTAAIGVAQAARFPSLSLTGALGAKSSSLGEFVSHNAFYSLGANLVGPLFTGGKSKARVEVERAKLRGATARYEMVVLNAFREVADALAAVGTHRIEHEARLRQLAAANQALDAIEALYEGGLVSYMEVLELEAGVFGAQLMVSEALQRRHKAVVSLYKALGGGWSVPEGAADPTGMEGQG